MCASIMDTCEWTWHPLKEIESYTMPQNEPAKTLHEKNKITNNELEDDGSQTMEDDDNAFDDEEIMSKITDIKEHTIKNIVIYPFLFLSTIVFPCM